MKSTLAIVLAASVIFSQQKAQAQESDKKVFSGPQVGEKLPALEFIKFGDKDGKKIDFIKQADGKAVVVIFMHQLTRPAASVVRGITSFCAKREKDGLRSCVIFLTDDPTAAEQRMQRTKNFLVPQEKTWFGISHQGIEGPGSYGLNRNVSLTVLVGKAGKVTANFVLKQPSLQADAPKIAEEIVKLVGGKAPTANELRGPRRRGKKQRKKTNRKRGEKQKKKTARKQDPNVRRLLGPVISKDAGPKRVKAAAKELEEYAAKHPRFKVAVGNIVRNIEKAGNLSRYGTPTAREFMKKWGQRMESSRTKR